MKLRRRDIREYCLAYCVAAPYVLITGVILNVFGLGRAFQAFFQVGAYVVVGTFFTAFLLGAVLED